MSQQTLELPDHIDMHDYICPEHGHVVSLTTPNALVVCSCGQDAKSRWQSTRSYERKRSKYAKAFNKSGR